MVGSSTTGSEVISFTSLTEHVQDVASDQSFPFDGDEIYERLFERLIRALHRSAPRHVLLMGERGVGQSTVLVEFARRAQSGTIPFLQEKEILSVDCRYVSPEESRSVLEAIFAHVGARENLIVCIRGLASLVLGRGAVDHRARLFSILARAQCRIIGLISPHESEEYFRSDPETMAFFSVIELEEPDVPVALRLLRHFAAGLAHEYDVEFEEEAIHRAVMLSHNYILNERLPYKALKILIAECDDIRFERTQLGAERSLVTAADVVRRVAAISGVPEQTLVGIADKTDYRKGLGDLIFGQDHAVQQVATELGLIKAGLTDAGKPASVMMFVGPTGTGKTEMAKALARFYSSSKRLKTFTLGNFVEPHSVSGIIGVPPGYVGHDQGGRLVNELNADPYSVFLLDEADKAHPDVMQPFLNLFDEGWVYDQRGVKAYADKALFILTTNVGQRQIIEMCREGKTIEEITAKMKESLAQIRHSKSNRPVFTPEFLARIKRFIIFQHLDKEALHNIAQRLVSEMQDTWQERRMKVLDIEAPIINQIADQAHDRNEKSRGKEGGRVVRKLLSDWVEAEIQQMVSTHPEKYRQCQTVAVRQRGTTLSDASNSNGAPALTVSFQ